MIPLLVSSGEPAGIGPDLCVALAEYDFPIVVLGDKAVLEARACQLNKRVKFFDYRFNEQIVNEPGSLSIISIPCPSPVVNGKLNVNNAFYVMDMLTSAAEWCKKKQFSALITAPIHKAIINEAGISFSGHTEFFAQFYQAETVVMMLACEQMKVALLTTHLPLRDVADKITPLRITKTITQLNQSLIHDFAIAKPRIKVAGLNPHAGESGYLGREEIEIINPTLELLRQQGIMVEGALPADTLFIPEHIEHCDAYLMMYHDQGLPVIKYAGFNQAVNVTLGLPIIRTSVDHGTALELAGKNSADTGSMLAAVAMAEKMVLARSQHGSN